MAPNKTPQWRRGKFQRWARIALGAALLAAVSPAPARTAEANIAMLIKAGHWKRARPLAEQRYQSNPHDADSAYLLSQIKLTFGDLDAARALAEQAVATDPKNSNYHYQLAVTCGRTAEKASLFSKGRWAKRFKEEAETAVSLDANNLDARFGLLEYYLQAPRLMGGGKEKARAMADAIARLDAVSGLLAEARLSEDRKDWSQELQAFSKAAAAEPKSYESMISIADYFLRGRAGGNTSGNSAATNPPTRADTIEKLARDAAQSKPDRIEAYTVLARLYSAQRRWKDLDALLGDSTKKVPDNLAPYYHAAEVLLIQGTELARAENYFRQYLLQPTEANSPSLAEAHWKLGLVLEKEGRKPQAIGELEAALSIDPSLEKARADLKRLNSGP